MSRDELFRKEALDALDETASTTGALLDISPGWARSAYLVLVAAALSSLSFAAFATVGDYASGPAVVRVEGRLDLTATASGTVERVDVHSGEHVKAGQVLVRFNVAQERGELDRLQTELEGQLAKLLRDPKDQAARETLTSLRAQRDLAQSRLEQRAVRAPREGIVSDLRIRSGELLVAGERVLSLVVAPAGGSSDGTRFIVVAFLPGQYRPLLHPGMLLGLRLSGFPRSSVLLTIDSVGDEIVGPAEVKRYLGQESGDALSVNGPVVLVKARLHGATFDAEDKTLHFYDGLPGTAEARVRAQPLLLALIPGLREAMTNGGD
jgi:membrane fusion protein (multidrug efflux system)